MRKKSHIQYIYADKICIHNMFLTIHPNGESVSTVHNYDSHINNTVSTHKKYREKYYFIN